MEGAMPLAELMEELSVYRQNQNEQGVANAAFKVGEHYLRKGKWQESLEFFQEAREICKKHDNHQGEVLAVLGLGEAYFQGAQPEKAMESLEAALDYYQKQNDQRGQANVLERIGDVQRSTGHVDTSLVHYRRVMEICREHGDEVGTANMNVKLGLAYSAVHDEKQALDCFEKALTFYDQFGVPDKQAFVLAAIGRIVVKKEPSRAVRFLNASRELYKRLGLRSATAALDREIHEIEAFQAEKSS